MPSYRGPKKAGNHSTLIKESVAVVNFSQKLEAVTKISPGYILSSSREKVSIKLSEQTGCVFVKVHGSSSVQELRIYTSDPQFVMATLREEFNDKKPW